MSDLNLPTRKRLRLEGYDYASKGVYFVTLCVDLRFSILGKALDGKVCLSPLGNMVERVWSEIPKHYPGVEIDAFVIMPNHVHGIIVLSGAVGADAPVGPHLNNPSAMSLPEVMRLFKSLTAKKYRNGIKDSSWREFSKTLWQRGYHDHIVRDDIELAKIRMYIQDNPLRWDEDEENTD